jgi:hypothetical protein
VTTYRWIDHVASVQGIEMDPDALVDDVVFIAYSFDQDDTFIAAMTQIVHSLLLLVKRRNMGQSLVGNFSDWRSFHFQSQRTKGHPADLRMVYKDTGTSIRVRGFGHRHLPQNIYLRLYSRP